MTGIVYCLTNPAMPGYVKIGMTKNLDQRLRQLDNTSVPVAFECVSAIDVDDPKKVEQLLHEAFDDRRVRRTREFFEVSPAQVVAALRLTGGRDVTPEAPITEDEEPERALQKAKQRRERFNFEMVGLSPGTEIYFLANKDDEPAHTAVVHSINRIMFEREERSLSSAAGELLRRRGCHQASPDRSTGTLETSHCPSAVAAWKTKGSDRPGRFNRQD